MAASPLVHMVGELPLKLKIGKPVHTRCGLDAIPTAYKPEGNRYTLTNLTGGDFEGTTVKSLCTCQKCVNLTTIGMIHAKAVRSPRQSSGRISEEAVTPKAERRTHAPARVQSGLGREKRSRVQADPRD